jgi:hypothetical protein
VPVRVAGDEPGGGPHLGAPRRPLGRASDAAIEAAGLREGRQAFRLLLFLLLDLPVVRGRRTLRRRRGRSRAPAGGTSRGPARDPERPRLVRMPAAVNGQPRLPGNPEDQGRDHDRAFAERRRRALANRFAEPRGIDDGTLCDRLAIGKTGGTLANAPIRPAAPTWFKYRDEPGTLACAGILGSSGGGGIRTHVGGVIPRNGFRDFRDGLRYRATC